MLKALRNFFEVTKPGMVAANMICVAGGFLLAARGCIDTALLLSTTIGTGLVVASGCLFNNWIDRHIDRKMTRTRNRVLARGRMTPSLAVVFATLLGAGGIALLQAKTNLLCVAIAVAGFCVYVVLYSLWLKRTSVYSTLIGSLAGAAPPLVGYCAVTHRLDLGALILLTIFSLWQIPHSYAVAIFRLDDYTAAAIPVLPVIRGISIAKKQIIGYILAFTTAASLLTFSGYTGYSYLAVTSVMGLSWLALAWSGYRTPVQAWAKKLFIVSIACIAALSIMMAIDIYMPGSGAHEPTNLRHSPQAENTGWPLPATTVGARCVP